MQATVRTFDPKTSSGTVLLDNGVEVPYDADSLAGGAVRHLRLGQRVGVELTGSGPSSRVGSLWIYTIGPSDG